MRIKVEIEKLRVEVPTPEYATSSSAGFDIVVDSFMKLVTQRNYVPETFSDKGELLYPGERILVGTGYRLAIPEGYQLEIRSRSGKTLKEGLVVANSPGTVDADYRGEVMVILHNISTDVITITRGDKVAQGVLMEYPQAMFDSVLSLSSETQRGIGGFGSTDLPKEGRSVDNQDY